MSLKKELLIRLEASREEDLSGQALADKLGVSRAAIWKAINSLRQDGYKILSGTNRGYRLSPEDDHISSAVIAGYLPEDYRNLTIFVHKEIDSTNTEAKRLLANGHTGKALILAESQTGGRGRLGRSFYSPAHTGVYMTLITQPDAALEDAVSITTAASVAVARAIKMLTAQEPQIKWVNDVYVDGKKVCGILTEAVTDFETGTAQSILVGIGVNVSTDQFPAEMADTAGALRASGLSRNRLIAVIASELLRLAEDLSDKSYMDEYRRHSFVIGKEIVYYEKNERFYAKAIGISDQGELIVQGEDGVQRLLKSGEITLRLA
jgi:BirA family biotin operon repressor/biotin-[acetyl-CoA-carboxylase] ligase